MTTRIDIEHLLDWAFRRESVETRRNPHGDALTVYWAVEALPEPYCSLVKRQARAGDCAAMAARPRPQHRQLVGASTGPRPLWRLAQGAGRAAADSRGSVADVSGHRACGAGSPLDDQRLRS